MVMHYTQIGQDSVNQQHETPARMHLVDARNTLKATEDEGFVPSLVMDW